MSFFKIQGLSEDEARERIWLVDSQGLVFDARGKLPAHKKCTYHHLLVYSHPLIFFTVFSRKDYDGPPMKNLVEILDYIKPTALLGLSTIKDAFYKEVVEKMAQLNPRPIIFPLSNPVRLSECEFEDAVKWTNGKVIFASGSPFAPVQYEGKTKFAGQGNNMYIFPGKFCKSYHFELAFLTFSLGIGLGAILSKASAITDTMVEAASLGLADALNKSEHADDLVYPRIERIRELSGDIAVSVIRAAQKAGVDRQPKLRDIKDSELKSWVTGKMWNP